jgi:hypothetical protein
MHQINFYWGFKNHRRQIRRADFLTLHVEDINFHDYSTPITGYRPLGRIIVSGQA